MRLLLRSISICLRNELACIKIDRDVWCSALLVKLYSGKPAAE
jgi:hypothetical protein